MTSSVKNGSGFLTLSDLNEIQTTENLKNPILTTEENGKVINIIEKLTRETERNPLAIDLHLGEQVFVSTNELPFRLGTNEHPSDAISIKPGEFALLLTKERVELPPFIFALISMRFKIKLKGLINVSGFHVDPAYRGKVLYSVYNAGPNPIILRKDDAIFTIIFARIDSGSTRLENPNFPEINFITPEHVSGLLGAPVSLQGLHDRIRTLEQWNKILIGLVSGVVVALISALFGGLK